MTNARITTVAVIKADGTESTFPRQDCKVDGSHRLHLWSCDAPGHPLFFHDYEQPTWREVTVYEFGSDRVLERFNNPGRVDVPVYAMGARS